jgi:predicted dinucleotide-binding enzyme
MNILLLGVGNMGSALAQQFTRAGHTVQLAATSFEKAAAVASGIPGRRLCKRPVVRRPTT